MQSQLNLQVEFLSKIKAAISIGFSTPNTDPDFALLVLFSSFALRQMHNIGIGHPVCQSLAKALFSINHPNDPINILLGPPNNSLNDLKQAMGDKNSDPMQNFVSLDSIELVPYNNQVGTKRFLATLTYDDQQSLLKLSPKGFSFMGDGINYFAPSSVGLLFRRLASLNSQNSDYLPSLVNTAKFSGKAILSGAVNAQSLITLPLHIVRDASRNSSTRIS